MNYDDLGIPLGAPHFWDAEIQRVLPAPPDAERCEEETDVLGVPVDMAKAGVNPDKDPSLYRCRLRRGHTGEHFAIGVSWSALG